MYDDVANSALNPRRGVIINHPEGEDVYAGVPKVLLSGFSHSKMGRLGSFCAQTYLFN
jgi:hypothetical protein